MSTTKKHLATVNGVPLREATSMIAEAFRVWKERSKHEWTVDIEWAVGPAVRRDAGQEVGNG